MKYFRKSFLLSLAYMSILAASLLLVCLPAHSETPAELGMRSVKFLSGFMREKDPQIREQAAAAWGEIGNKAAIPMLKKALKDKSPLVRIEAAYSLHTLGDESGLEVLEKIVDISTAAPVRAPRTPAEELAEIAKTNARVQGIARLAEMGGVRAVAIFEKTIEDPSAAVRDASAIALAKMGFDELDQAFIDTLGAKNDSVRAAAAKALGQLGRSVGVEELRLATTDPAAGVRAEAMRSLGASPELGVLDVLTKGAHDQDKMVRAAAIGSLAKVPGPAATKVLFEISVDTSSPALAVKALAGLAAKGETVDLSLVERILNRGDSDLMVDGVDVLKAQKGDAATGLLVRTMEGSLDLRVRLKAAAVLVKRLQRSGGP